MTPSLPRYTLVAPPAVRPSAAEPATCISPAHSTGGTARPPAAVAAPLPPRPLPRGGDQRHHAPVAAQVHTGRAARRPAVGGRPVQRQPPRALRRQHRLPFRLDQPPQRLATGPDLSGPGQV